MNKTFIYFVFLIAASAAIVMPAQGDTLVVFKDGSQHVWTNIHHNYDARVCTMLEIGEYCVLVSDVVKLREVPAGTRANDFGFNSGENKIDPGASAVNQRAIDDMNAQANKRDAQMDRDQKKYEKQQLRKKLDGKSEWAQ